MDRVNAGERLTSAEIAQLVATPDILPLGMLADALRRRLHGRAVTYLRVARVRVRRVVHRSGPARGARGAADRHAGDARRAPSRRSARPRRWLAIASCPAFPGRTIERAGPARNVASPRARDELRERRARRDRRAATRCGSTRLAPPSSSSRRPAIEQLRLTIDKAPAAERAGLFAAGRRAPAALRLHPGASTRCRRSSTPCRPTTGYDDVKMVAHREAGRAEHPDDPGGLAPLRSEAGAGRADIRRRRSRRRDGRPTMRPTAAAVRRSRRCAATSRRRASRPSERDGRFARRRVMAPRSRIGAVGYLNARPLTWALDRVAGSLARALRRAVGVRGAAARRRDRSRAGSVDRVPAVA